MRDSRTVIRYQLKKQRGYGIASAMFALLVGSVVTSGIVANMKFRSQQEVGTEIAKRVNPVRTAINTYISENYNSLQAGDPITINGVTIAPGADEGSTYSPRVEDLVALGYLPAGYSGVVPVFGTDAYFKTALRKEPVGCAPEDCEIPGYLYLSKPALRNGSEPNAVLIGKYRVEIGPDALIASNTNPTKLISGQGVEVGNPVAGTPAGVIGSLVGWGSSTYGNWLTLNDTRDPNFRGDLSVKGEIKSETSVTAPIITGTDSVGAGKGDDGSCSLAELKGTGEIFSRIGSCLNKVVISPAGALITTFYNTGVKSVEINGQSGEVTARNAAGKTTVEMKGNSSEFVLTSSTDNKRVVLNATAGEFAISDGISNVIRASATGDIESNKAGWTAGITNSDASARVHGQVFNAKSYRVPASACSVPNTDGDIAQSATGSGLVMCTGGVWRALTGKAGVSIGDNCSVQGELGSTNNGVTLICSGGKWVNLEDRFGKRILVGSYFVSNGTWINKPACVSGTTGSAIYIVPKSFTTDSQSTNYAAVDYGGRWQTVIENNVSAAVPGEGIAMIYCMY